MNYVKREKEYSYLLKHQLHHFSVDGLKQEYLKDDMSFEKFLNHLHEMLIDDPCSLLIEKRNINKIFELINEYRFSDFGNKKLTNIENDFIVKLNIVKQRINDEDLINIYLKQQKLGRIWIGDIKPVLPELLAYDYNVIDALKNGTIEKLNSTLFLSSSAYLMLEYPELYKENPNFLKQSINYLDQIKLDGDRLTSKCSKKLSKNMTKILKKVDR